MRLAGLARIGALVMGAALALHAPPACADEVREPRSGVSFPTERQGLSLAGVGLRTKLFVKIYAVGFYLDPGAAHRLLAEFQGRSAADLAQSDRFYARLLSDELGKTMAMRFVYDAGTRRVREAFQEGIEANLPGTSPAAEAFLALFQGELGNKGDALVIRTAPGGEVRVELNDRELGRVTDVPLSVALWKVWFGPNPILPNLKRDLIDRVPALLE